VSENTTFGIANTTLNNVTGQQLLNINLNLYKELKFKIMVKYPMSLIFISYVIIFIIFFFVVVEYKLFKIENEEKIKMLQIPKFNYCNIRRSGSTVPLISKLFNELLKYGNIVAPCPIKPGNYFIKNFPVQTSGLLSFFPAGLYTSAIQLLDENAKSKTIIKIELFFSRV
jgi:hypothetical protein